MSEIQFASATQRLRTQGIELTGPAGTLAKDGVTAKYAYADGSLAIEIVDWPFLLPIPLVEAKLRAYLEQTVGSDMGRQES